MLRIVRNLDRFLGFGVAIPCEQVKFRFSQKAGNLFTCIWLLASEGGLCSTELIN
jgi:hypothetical protein